MPSLHLICRGSQHVRTLKFPEFESGFWDLNEGDAARLVSGMIYLHETKSTPSYFGGEVLAYRLASADELMPGRVVFRFRSLPEAKNVRWTGAKHGMAWSSGVLD